MNSDSGILPLALWRRGKRRDFSPALAAYGGGHIPVPGWPSNELVSSLGVARSTMGN